MLVSSALLEVLMAPEAAHDMAAWCARWLGHGTMWILSVHGCGFYALWLWEHDWLLSPVVK